MGVLRFIAWNMRCKAMDLNLSNLFGRTFWKDNSREKFILKGYLYSTYKSLTVKYKTYSIAKKNNIPSWKWNFEPYILKTEKDLEWKNVKKTKKKNRICGKTIYKGRCVSTWWQKIRGGAFTTTCIRSS